MFSRTWLAVLAGSVALWGMNQLGAGPPSPEPDAGSVSPARASDFSSVAVPELAACLDQVVSLDAAVSAGSVVQGASSVERRYRERCRPGLDGGAFDAFAAAYGERSRGAVALILEREERLAAELVSGPQAGALDPDVVWAAALGRAASDARAFYAELVAWFDTRAPAGGPRVSMAAADGGAGVALAGAPAR